MSANDLILFWEQKLKNGRLAAILNSSNFVIFFILYLGLMTYPLNFRNDLDYDPDAEPGLRSFISAKICSL